MNRIGRRTGSFPRASCRPAVGRFAASFRASRVVAVVRAALARGVLQDSEFSVAR